MSPWIERAGGAVAGLYANRQPGVAEEFLPRDAAAVRAFEDATAAAVDAVANPPAPQPGASIEERLAGLEAATVALVKKGALTAEEIEAELPAKGAVDAGPGARSSG